MEDRLFITTTDTKLLFRQQRVRNTRIAIKKIEEWLSNESKVHFPGRIFTVEYQEKLIKLKYLNNLLKEIERDLSVYRNKMYRDRRKNFALICK